MERCCKYANKYRRCLERNILIMAEIIKINDTTVTEVGTKEVRTVYGKTELVKRKESLEAQLLVVNELLAVFK